MKRFAILLLTLAFALSPYAQKQQTRKQTARTTTTQKKASTQQKKTTTTQKGKTSQQNKKKQKQQGKKRGKQNTQNYTNADIKKLQNQRAEVQKKLKEHEKMLQNNRADVKKGLDNLMSINSEINEQQRTIDGIKQDIDHLDGNINLLQAQLQTLEQQLKDRKEKYVKSMRYMARHRKIQDQLMFIFSAKNFAQMYRRLRFARDYSAFQRAQGEEVKAKQAQIMAKHKELEQVKGQKNTLLYKGKKAQETLQGKQQEQQEMVKSLQKQQKTIQGIIDDQKKKNAQLNAEIDRLVAIEVEKARQRAAEEARKKAAEQAAAKKKRQEELARKKAAAEAAERENQKRIAEAREREAKAKTQQEARQAQAEREAAERKAAVERRRHKQEVDKATKESEEAMTVSSVDRKLSNNFESNRGRLPMPITGSYRIVSHYGQYNVEGLKGVTLDNKGINILGQAGAQARAIFNGEVSAVFSFDGASVVMVRHGSYISVYCNLKSVSVSQGQKVSTRQALGTVGADNILQFQLRRETKKLNPEVWLGR
ncbi:MAG: peptidoglycan DD-metalloendopeptidase family protein [Prevotella sp.]|nr:peptidoglycan DD-metalloendopeptidase family protein [Prevotella sp.]